MTTDVIQTARRRSRRLLLVTLAATAGVVVAVCAAALAVTGTVTTGPAPTSAPLASESGAVGVVMLPADVTWTTVAGVALPGSATAGPRHRDGGLAAGFAHTPAGALLAAVHLLVNTTPQVGPAVFAPTLASQVVGEHADAMRAAVQASYATLGGDGGPIGSLTSALAGARLAGYDQTAGTVDLLTVAIDATGTARFAATPVRLVWTGADWALLAPPDGEWDGIVRPVTPAQAATWPPLAPGR
jgi:hypothetical protein